MTTVASSPPLQPRDDPAHELRLVFMGTPAFSVPSLRALLSVHDVAGRPARVVAVVTQPDRPAGRGGRVQASPVKLVAREAGVPVLQPERLRRPEHVAELRAYGPDLIVVAAFAQILSPEVLGLPPHGCLNVHASLLPRWRGASPIPAAILAGDLTTGITVMQMDAGLDIGPIVARRAETIRPGDTAATLAERLATLGAALLVDTLGPWVSGQIAPRPQDEAQATLTRPLRREDGLIDWNSVCAATAARMVRAYNPWPGAYTRYANRVLKLWQADALDATIDAPPGRVLDRAEALPLLEALARATAGSPRAGSEEQWPGYRRAASGAGPVASAAGLRWPQLLAVCQEGVLLVRRVQLEGKRPMGSDEFMRGQPGVAGAQLG